MSTHLAYSALTPSLPSRRPGISANWRRTSTIICWAARPTDFIVSAAKAKVSIAADEQADDHLDVGEVDHGDADRAV
jgi:hypothetical protein